jgi:site-specific DNA recombinase
MKAASLKPVRCAIYTRVSTDQGLDQEFNSLDAQYEAASAYIKSQAHAGWTLIRSRYDDGGYSGGSTDRPDLQRLLDDIRARKIDVIVVYKVDRLTRSLADFAKWSNCSMPRGCRLSRSPSSSIPRPRWAG